MRVTVKLTFEYIITENTVEYNGNKYSWEEFLALENELHPMTRKETTRILEKNEYCADYVHITENGILLENEIYCICDMLRMNDFRQEEYKPIDVPSKHVKGIYYNEYIMLLDDEKTRYGRYSIIDIINAGSPVDETEIPIRPNCNIHLSRKYPHLRGQHLGLGWTKSDYKKFISQLEEYMNVYKYNFNVSYYIDTHSYFAGSDGNDSCITFTDVTYRVYNLLQFKKYCTDNSNILRCEDDIINALSYFTYQLNNQYN